MTRSAQQTALVLVALVAAACAAPGQEKNYKELERRQTDPFQTEKDPFFGGRITTSTIAAQVTDVTQPAGSQVASHRDGEPSLGGLDRTHWPHVGFGPANGRTIHNPIYFGRVNRGDDQIDVLMAPPGRWRFDEAVHGSRPDNLGAQNLLEAVVAPVRFGANLALLPVAALRQPPLALTTTP